MHFEGLRHLTADGEDGVEGGHGLLEDNGDVLATPASHLVVAELEQVCAVEEDLAFDDLAWGGRDETHQGESADGLAAPALADKAHCFPGSERVGDAVDGLDHTVLGVEVGL